MSFFNWYSRTSSLPGGGRRKKRFTSHVNSVDLTGYSPLSSTSSFERPVISSRCILHCRTNSLRHMSTPPSPMEVPVNLLFSLHCRENPREPCHKRSILKVLVISALLTLDSKWIISLEGHCILDEFTCTLLPSVEIKLVFFSLAVLHQPDSGKVN